MSESQHNVYQLSRVLTLMAMASEMQGKREEAVEALERAVALARKGELFLPFVELGMPMVDLLGQLPGEREFTARIERLVTAFGASPDRHIPIETRPGDPQMRRREGRPEAAGDHHEDLTNRELEVLELLSRRLQNKEIAARLGISSQTVNSHLKQVYQKLGAHSRREAVERAVAAGVLDRNPPD